MLIIPLSRKLTLQTFPIMTALLVVANVFVFFALQVPDGRVIREFVDTAMKSGLPQLELPVYAEWRSSKGERTAAPSPALLEDPKYLAQGTLTMQRDRAFQRELGSRMNTALASEQFAQWQTARAKVDPIWQKNFTERYIFVPASAFVETYLTHMFMHADFGHLFGNMVMLVLIGLLVEAAAGPLRTGAIYLVGGIGALLLYTLFSTDRWVGMLGASGAIAAMMGACAALYGFRRVRFFYHVLFYFDFITLPAIVVLPLWIGNELWQWTQFRDVSNVAYFAHIGGLIAGASFALLLRKTVAARLENAATPSLEKVEDLARQHERAYAALKKMQWDAAGREFEQLLLQVPDNLDYARQLYTASRTEPVSARYHWGARQLMKLAAKTGAPALLGQTIAEYWKNAQPAPRLSTDEIARYAKILAKEGTRDIAVTLTDALIKLPEARMGNVDLADVLLTMAVALSRAGNSDEKKLSQRYVETLERRFPDSGQLKLARQLVSG